MFIFGNFDYSVSNILILAVQGFSNRQRAKLFVGIIFSLFASNSCCSVGLYNWLSNWKTLSLSRCNYDE